MGSDRYRHRWLRALWLSLSVPLVAGSIGCGVSSNASTAPGSSTAPGKTLTAITTSPTSASVAIGATEQFTAMAAYSDGSTANVTSMASWTSAEMSVATVSSTGMALGIA